MQIEISRPTNGEREAAEYYRLARQVGYTGLQLKSMQYSDWVEEPERLCRAVSDGPAVTGVVLQCGLDDAGQERVRAVTRFCRAVGARRIVFCHDFPRAQTSDDDRRRFARILSHLGEEAAEFGIRISLHHHVGQPVMRRRDFDGFFEAVTEGCVGLTLDTAHLALAGIDDFGEIALTFAQLIDNVHLKDVAGDRFRLLGEGTLKFEPLVEALQDWSPVWCVDEESGAPLTSGATQSFAAVSRLLHL
ncbi:sugar phosphate isomerase/epimerase [Gryllotalpicola protaetiae]|uniref:Sugar phosphate isomerase/epimerase n=1 Tax=Gryllotalpicola protaetiae TaxID=2419771 RepID=A0A387BKM2_9MICO|nr:sugar phosphate isomerase/epimerase [Gryllotalpicola protaetiae]